MGCSSSATVFLIKTIVSTNYENFGVQCYNADPKFFLDSFWLSDKIAFAQVRDLGPLGGVINSVYASTRSECKSTEKTFKDIKVTEYGQLVEKETFYSLSNKQLYHSKVLPCSGPGCECLDEGGRGAFAFEYKRENGIVTQDISNCLNNAGDPPGCINQSDSCFEYSNGNCFPSVIPGIYTVITPGPDGLGLIEDKVTPSATDCTEYNFKYNEYTEDLYGVDYVQYGSFIGKLNKEINYDYLAPKAELAANIKLNILHENKNQNPQNTNCGPEKTSCYSPASSNTINPPLNKNITSYDIFFEKFRVRLGEDKQFLENNLSPKKYTVYAYYYSSENPDTTVSPCCNSCGCFDGTIVKEKNITLSYSARSDDKQGELILSSDSMEFDNLNYFGPSKTLYFCSKAIS